jgi:hypothetical protein
MMALYFARKTHEVYNLMTFTKSFRVLFSAVFSFHAESTEVTGVSLLILLKTIFTEE